MNLNFTKEACVDNIHDAINVEKNGADQIELCSRLDLDGLTPSKKLILQTIRAVSVPIKVMIRSRPGDFTYNQDDINTMLDSIRFCLKNGINDIAFGALNSKRKIDEKNINQIISRYKELNITFHKAIDLVDNQIDEIKKLLKFNQIKAILTSGGQKNAIEGQENIKKLFECFKNKIDIIAAGKITNKNITKIHNTLGLKIYHGKKIVNN
ncbi:MAG: copper homeostasis protein CutC [bacterium TMED144]|nr:MAG: copper homeostasis protein CutC [bacterium TMED144]|tara:strand:+ start:592 stop:1221 length:630 start_codon:yes stop_codon:yes gene_type:complete